MESYDPKKIESKWQKKWEESGLYNAGERDAPKEKEYVLVEWPYPSGNLHIGHWYAFAVPDIYVRAHRMQGKQVLFPMGFDAFGLPAENAAIKRGLDPKKWTEENVAFMKGQLQSMGNAFTWDKTTSSTDTEYYRWTQWMFAKFFEHDIAYRGKGMVNWCPSCNTVLANEQVVDGACERCGATVEKREMDEWKMRITKYADRLVDDLDALDWPEHIKEAQRNWIGRSKGALLPLKLKTGEKELSVIEVFTTRADTLFGAASLVLAPEHKELEVLKSYVENWDEVALYIEKARQKTEIERTNAEKEKTGVELRGVKAVNPGNGEALPVYVADYVLGGYGTGAIMTVPAHDERDFAFAKKFGLSLKQVIESESELPDPREGILINSGEFTGMRSEEAREAITKRVGGKLANTYRLRDWSVGRQRYWGVPIPIVYDPDGKPHTIPEEHLPWLLPTDVDFRPTGESPLAKSKELKERTERLFGKGWTPEVETMDTFVDSSWYFLRYIDNDNDTSLSSLERQKAWMPVDIYFGGAEHTTLHLLYSRFWQKVLFDMGLATEHEPYKKRINRGLVLGPDGNKMSKSKGNVIDPDEQVARLGADTVKMYLAFMGPYGQLGNYPWDMGGIAGIRRFLERVFALSGHLRDSDAEDIESHLHRTIKKVTEDIELFKFNTAISALMIFLNVVEKTGLSHASFRTLLLLLAPFAPHLAEELWEQTGEGGSIHEASWPSYDISKLTEKRFTLVVQIDGKVRDEVEVDAEAGEAAVEQIVLALPKVKERLHGQSPRKVVFVPGKLINLVL